MEVHSAERSRKDVQLCLQVLLSALNPLPTMGCIVGMISCRFLLCVVGWLFYGQFLKVI